MKEMKRLKQTHSEWNGKFFATPEKLANYEAKTVGALPLYKIPDRYGMVTYYWLDWGIKKIKVIQTDRQKKAF